MPRRLLSALVSIPLLTLCACEREAAPPAEEAADAPAGAADSADPGARAADAPEAQVTPELQAEMNDYVSNLNRSNEILEEIDNAVEAAAASPELAPIVEELKQFKQRWDELDAPTKEELKSAFRDQLNPVVEQINAQIRKINEDPTIGGAIEELVGEIPLINL